MIDTHITGPRTKMLAFDELPALRRRFASKRIVQCHGAFDLVHLGHLTHFEEAKSLGDVLVVTLTGDLHITKKRSVTFTEDQRARQVAALEIVDYVAIVQEPTALSAIEALQPDVYVKGPEYADLTLDKSRSIYHEMRVLEAYGGRMHFTSGGTFSSSKLSHFLLAAPDAAQRDPLLQNDHVRFRDISSFGFTLDCLKQFVARAASLRVCVIGESIVDEWVDVSVTGLSTQSRCVAGIEIERATQTGGVGIIARHLAGFVRTVEAVTNGATSGEATDNIAYTPIAAGDLVETRFVDTETGRPVFKSKRVTLGPARLDLVPRFDDYDLVLIADFGHGLLDANALNRQIAERRRASVAVMAQVNSSNYGYNLPLKYVGADYYCLNRTEAELCLHERHLAVDELVERSRRLLDCRAVSITDGERGVVVAHDGEKYALPSLSVSVVDSIGCGDAYFALSSVAMRLNMPAAIVALAGSIGAAAMTQRRCNASPVTEQEFLTIGKIVI